MSLSCHRATFSRAGTTVAHQAGEAGQVLREHRVALVGHGGTALLAVREAFLDLAHLAPLQMADLHRQPLHRGCHHGQRREKGGVAVAGDDLGGDRLDRQPQTGRDMGLYPRIDGGEGADGAGDGADGDLLAGGLQAPPGAPELGVMAGQLEAEGGGFGVDAVAAADAGRGGVLARAPGERRQQGVRVLDQQVGSLGELRGEAGVQHVRRGHAAVHEAGFVADMLGDVGEKGDHVVAGVALDLVDAPDLEGAALAQRGGDPLRHDAQGLHGLGRQGFDLQHDAKAVFRFPDGGHAGARVTRDHGFKRAPEPPGPGPRRCRWPSRRRRWARPRRWSRSARRRLAAALCRAPPAHWPARPAPRRGGP